MRVFSLFLLIALACQVQADIGAFINSRLLQPIISFNLDQPPNYLNFYPNCNSNFLSNPAYCVLAWKPSCYSGSGCAVLGPFAASDFSTYRPSSNALQLNQIPANGIWSPSPYFSNTYPNTANINPSIAIRAVFQLTRPLIGSKTLFELSLDRTGSGCAATDSIKVTIDGYTTNGAPDSTKSIYENNLLTRVYNSGYSCSQNGNGCGGDLPGIIKPGIWYDMTFSFDSYGVLCIYMNSTLISRAPGYRLPTSRIYQYSLNVGNSLSPLEPTMEIINIRLLDIYNMSLSSNHVANIGNSEKYIRSLANVYRGYRSQPASYYQSESTVDSLFASSFYVPAVDVPIIPQYFFVSFNDLSSFTPDLRFNNQTAYLFGNTKYVMDVLNTPNYNGLYLRDSSAYIKLSTYLGGIVMGGSSTFTIQYKFNPNRTVANNTILFACSTLTANGTETDKIVLFVSSASGFGDVITFQVFRGDHTVFTLSGNVSVPLAQPPHALGVYDISIVLNIDGTSHMYNHGFLVGNGVGMGLPYVNLRTCTLGRNINSRNAVVPFNGAIFSFGYIPYALDMMDIVGSLLPNVTVSVPFYGNSVAQEQSFSTPYFITDIHKLDDVTRNGAYYQPNTTSIVTLATPPQVTSNIASQDFTSSSSSNDPSANQLSNSMSEGEVVPVLNTFEGSMVLANGGYLNLGQSYISASESKGLTIRLRFQFINKLVANATLFATHNRIAPAFLDSLIVRTGNTNVYSSDLVIEVWVNGAVCNNTNIACSLTVPGAFHLNRFTDLIITFNSGNTFVFIDSKQVALSTTLWNPSAVERYYTFIGYSGYSGTLDYLPSQDMQLYSYSIIPKAVLYVDIITMSPPLSQTYSFRFLNPPPVYNISTLGLSDAFNLMEPATTLSFFGKAQWSSDPFNRNGFGLPTDSTNPDVTITTNTPGIYLGNTNSSAVMDTLLALSGPVRSAQQQLTACLNTLGNATTFQGQFQKYQQLYLAGTTIDLTPPSNSTNGTNATAAPTTPPPVVDTLSAINSLLSSTVQLFPFFTNLLNSNAVTLPLQDGSLFKGVGLSYNRLVSMTSSSCVPYQEALSNPQTVNNINVLTNLLNSSGIGSFISLGPQYLSSDGSIRIKFRVNSNTTVQNWMPILDISNGNINGAYADGFLITASGPNQALMVNISICRGANLCQSITAGPIDNSRYWIDMFVVMDAVGNVKIYNWGRLINYGKMWLNIPGPRNFTLLGASLFSTNPYLIDGAIGLYQYFPTVMSSVDIGALYTYDQPPLNVPNQDGSLYSMDPALTTSFVWRPPYDNPVGCGMCKKRFANGWNSLQCAAQCAPISSIDCTNFDATYRNTNPSQFDPQAYQEIEFLNNLAADDGFAFLFPPIAEVLIEESVQAAKAASLLHHACAVRADVKSPHLYAFPPTPFDPAALQLSFYTTFNVDTPYASYWNYDDSFCSLSGNFGPSQCALFPAPANNGNNPTKYPAPDPSIDVGSILLESYPISSTWPNLINNTWQPYFNYSVYVKSLINPVNWFDDKQYAAPPGSSIAGISFYEPMLLVYKNRPVASGQDVSKPFAYDISFVDKYLTGAFLSETPDGGWQVSDQIGSTNNWASFADIGDILYIVPPKIAFQYTSPGNSNVVPPIETRASTIFTKANIPYDPFTSDRFMTNYNPAPSSTIIPTSAPLPKASNPSLGPIPDLPGQVNIPSATPTNTKMNVGSSGLKSYTLLKNEYIIEVISICNYQFTFKTNFGNSYIVGNSTFISSIPGTTPCFSGLTQTLPSNTAGSVTPTLMNAAPYSESFPGHSLNYMKGSKGGMYAYQFNWILTPISQEMFNMVFDFDASTALTGAAPSQAIALDMYNHSPLEQTNWMTHSLSTTAESSISVTNGNDNSASSGWHVEGHLDVMPLGIGGGVSGGYHSDSVTATNFANTTGSSYSTTQDDTQMLMANIPPYSKVTANLLVFTGFVDIPFTADVLITYDGGFSEHVIKHGIYNSVRTTSIIVTYSEAKPIDKHHPVGGSSDKQ